MIGGLIIMTSCDKELAELDQNKVLRKISVQEQELINSTNRLSLDILKAEYSRNQKDNVLFSPVSVGMALGMIYNGVGEVEKAKIQQVMALEVLMEKELNKSYNELLNFFHLTNSQLDIAYANSMWFSHDVDINEDFRTKLMAYYDAEVTELNYKKPSAVEYINSWGNLKTNGSFEHLINITPSKSEDIFLINAFSLNTSWKTEGNIYRSTSTFNVRDGATQEVETLNWDGADIRYNHQGEFAYFEIPFENDVVLLSIIQPEDSRSLSSIMEEISSDELRFLSSSAESLKANISMPEVDFNNSTSLKTTLSGIGLSELFMSNANLSPSFASGNRHLSDIKHLSRIRTKSHQLSYQSTASFSNENLVELNVNDPFIYFVQDKHTNTVLFAGYYVSPSASE